MKAAIMMNQGLSLRKSLESLGTSRGSVLLQRASRKKGQRIAQKRFNPVRDQTIRIAETNVWHTDD